MPLLRPKPGGPVALIAAYRSLFSDTYNQLKIDIAELRAAVERDFGDKATGALTTQAATNAAALEFWRRYCTIAPDVLFRPEGCRAGPSRPQGAGPPSRP